MHQQSALLEWLFVVLGKCEWDGAGNIFPYWLTATSHSHLPNTTNNHSNNEYYNPNWDETFGIQKRFGYLNDNHFQSYSHTVE